MDFTTATPLTRNVPLYQQAYQEIKREILTGKIKPGTKLSENVLAEQYKVSRTPLREAIRQLQIEGLLISDGVSTTVVELSVKDFEELCYCRLVLEKEVVKLSIKNITDEDIAVMERFLEQAESELNGDSDINYLEVLQYNTQFHDHIIKCCGNHRLVQLLEQTRLLLLLYRANALVSAPNNRDFVNEHRGILEAIKNRDIDKAIVAIEEHLKGDLERGKRFLSVE